MAVSCFHVLAFTSLACTFLPLLAQAQVLPGGCSPQPCLNGGTCREIFGRLHVCTCPEKYTGGNCETLLPCFATPCQNGGTCVNVELGEFLTRVCNCPEGTSGDGCEIVLGCEDDEFSCDGQCFPQNATCDFKPDCSDGSDEEGCNEVRVRPDGVYITSPDFPDPGYPEEFDYTWFLTAEPGFFVALDFEGLYLDYQEDFLYIGQGRDDNIDNALYNFTGYYEVLRILPTSESLWLRFVTNEDKGYSPGFKVRAYSVSEPEEEQCDIDEEFDCGDGVCLISFIKCDGFPHCPNGADESKCPRTNCNDGSFIPPSEFCNLMWYCSEGEDEEDCPPKTLGELFYIESPLDPKGEEFQYFPNSNATWSLTAEEGLGFLISFPAFAIEPFYDLWFVGEGRKLEEENLLQTFTGYDVPEPFLVESDEMFVFFFTDDDKNNGYVGMLVEVVDRNDLLRCGKGTFVPKAHICDGLWHCESGLDEANCGPLYPNTSVSLLSPGYPFPYDNFAQAFWTFRTLENLRLLVEFSVFGTEKNYDVMRIGSGSACMDDYYEELSGNLDSLVVLSQDNTMCLFFHADRSITDRGFLGTLRAVDETGYLICPENGKIVPASNICDFYWNCEESGEDEKNCPPYGVNFTLPFTTPDYPSPLPPNTTWTWTLPVEEGLTSIFTFYDFDLVENVDFYSLGCGDDPTDASQYLSILTGNETPPPIVAADCTSVWVRLQTGPGNGLEDTRIGYSGEIRIIEGEAPRFCDVFRILPPTEVCNQDVFCADFTDESDCDAVPDGFRRVLTSPGYPETNYDDNAILAWVFKGEPGTKFAVTVNEFDTELFYDFLYIGYGNTPNNETGLAALTGSFEDLYITNLETPRNELWVVFESDFSITRSGFSITVTSVPAFVLCPENGREFSARFICDFLWDCEESGEDERDCAPYGDGFRLPYASPDYPSPLPDSSTWTVTFPVEEGLTTNFTFYDFNLIEGVDFVTIGCGLDPTDESQFIAVLTGHETPPPVVANCPLIFTRLETGIAEGSSEPRTGVSGLIQVSDEEVPGFCDGKEIPPSEVCNQDVLCSDYSDERDCDALPVGYRRVITSPGYPETNYNDSTLLAWFFKGEPNTRFTVAVLEFHLEQSFDFLYVGYGDTPNEETGLAAFTGTVEDLLTTNLETPGNELWVVFQSDFSITSSGFAIIVTSVPEFVVCPENGQQVPARSICDSFWDCEESGEDEKDCAPFGEGTRLPYITPGYPSPLPDSTTWTFMLPVEEGLTTTVFFYDFNLIENVDSYTIGCGMDPTDESQNIAVLTGQETPLPITVNCPLIFVRLQTGIAGGLLESRTGFAGIVLLTSGEEPDTCDGRPLSRYEVCNQDVECSDFSDERDCDALPVGFRRVLTSLGYDDYFLRAWVFKGEPDAKFSVEVNEFNTELNRDFVYIGYGNNPSNETGLAALTGSYEDLFITQLETPGNELWVVFQNDGSTTDSFFSITVTSVPASIICPENGREVSASDICDFEWNCEETGEDEKNCASFGEGFRLPFASPGYPSPLPDSTTWIWTLPVEEGLTTTFTVYDLNLIDGVDFMTIGCGMDPTDESQYITVLTGHQIPEPVVANCPLIFAVLQTGIAEGSLEPRSGFYGIIEVTAEEKTRTCDGRELLPSDICNQEVFCSDFSDERDCDAVPVGFRRVLTSPGYPEMNYNDETVLSWTFKGEPNTKFILTVNEFDLETNFDFLYIGYGFYPSTETGLAALTGLIEFLDTTNFETPGNELWIVFQSDFSITGRGFSITVTSVPVSKVCPENGMEVSASNICDFYWNCEDTGEDEKDCAPFGEDFRLPFATPDYPLPLPDSTTWTWTMPVEEGLTTTLTFYDLNLVDGVDFMTIGCGMDPTDESQYIAVLTGHETPPPVIASCSLIFVQLQTGIAEGSSELRNGSTGIIQVTTAPLFCDGRELPTSEVCNQDVFCSDYSDERSCDALPVGYRRVITSPGYPQTNYNDSTILAWFFKGEPGTKFTVAVNEFNTEAAFDYVFVGFGNTPSEETGLAAFSGTIEDLSTLNLETPGNDLWIVFQSDGSVTDSGFSITVTSVPAFLVCPENGREVAAVSICNFYWDCEESGEDEKDCAPFSEDFILRFATPDYPSPLPDSTTWTWTLPVEEGLTTTVYFDVFHLIENVDFYTIGCGMDPTDESQNIAVLTGHETPLPVIANCPLVFARLKTGLAEGSSDLRTGTTGIIQVFSGEGLETCDGRVLLQPEVCNQDVYCTDFRDERDCDAVPVGFRRVLTSPGYPEMNYDDNTILAWVFKGEPDTKFAVAVNEFNTEQYYDFLYIGYGNTPDNETGLAALTGSFEDLYIINLETPGNELWVVFQSDGSRTDSGFSITVTSVPDSILCPEHGREVSAVSICDFTWNCEETGEDEKDCAPYGEGFRLVVASPDYPSSLPDSTTWTWTLPVEEGLITTFMFDEFNLIDGVDFLTFGCGMDPTDESQYIAVLTGHETPNPVIANCSLIFALLQTGIAKESSELRAVYTGLIEITAKKTPGTCDGRELPPEEFCNQEAFCSDYLDERDCDAVPVGFRRVLTSPGYPETNYNDSTLIVWLFKGEPGTKFTVAVNELDLEGGFDFVYLGYGDNPNTETGLAALTGLREFLDATNLETPGNELWVVFQTDSSVTASGFSITVTSVPASEFCPENGREVSASSICDFYWNCEETGEDEKDCAPLGEGFRLPFETPGYPSPLPDSTTWTWTLPVEEGLTTTFTVYDLNLVDGVDFMTIGCGMDPTDESQYIAVLTGHETPPPIIANCSLIFTQLQTGIAEGSSELRNGSSGIVQVAAPREGCSPSHCMFNGVCVGDTEGEHFCICDEGFTGEHCEIEFEAVSGICRNYLPYGEARVSPLFNFNIILARDIISTIILDTSCPSQNYEAICRILYPPADDEAFPQAPCPETCEAFSQCRNLVLLVDYDCSVFEDFTVPDFNFPGMCNELPDETGCPSDSDFCANGGTCFEDSLGQAQCDCPEGYTGEYCEIEFEYITSGCAEYLPYDQSALTPLVMMNLPLSRDDVSRLILNEACPVLEVRRAICYALYPPTHAVVRQGVCADTCDMFSECTNISLLLDVDCSLFADFDDPLTGYPGLCSSDD